MTLPDSLLLWSECQGGFAQRKNSRIVVFVKALGVLVLSDLKNISIVINKEAEIVACECETTV